MKSYIIKDYREVIREKAPNFVEMMERMGIQDFPFKVKETGEMSDGGLYPVVRDKNGLEMSLMYYQYVSINQ